MCEIANKIKARRHELGLTLEEVAKEVGVGRSTVQRWESGLIKNMGRDKIAALANVLKINPIDLVPCPSFEEAPYVPWPDEIEQDRLEALHQNPKLGILFDRSMKMSSEDVDFMIQMADRILKERDGE